MFSIYLTPASISFLTQFILSLAITIFLARRLHHRTPQLVLLTCFFAGATTFIGLMFLDAALPPYPRLLWAVYAENTVLALMLVFLIQFAYRFPKKYPQHKWEARAGLVISLVYFFWEAGFMVYRYVSLLGQEMVYYRPGFPIYMMGFVMILPPIAFARQCIASDARATGSRFSARAAGLAVPPFSRLSAPLGDAHNCARWAVSARMGLTPAIHCVTMSSMCGPAPDAMLPAKCHVRHALCLRMPIDPACGVN